MQSITHAIIVGSEAPNHSTFARACLSSCRKVLAQLTSIKAGIQAEFRGRLEDHDHLLELAINEAEALAWQTGLPQLFFPTLATEKAQSVASWHERQRYLRQQGAQRAAAD